MSATTTLWYFADPMCSWCWGFSPVITQLRAHYAEKMKITLMLGGLRPGTTEVLSSTLREEILHHWQDVQRMTGQPFSFAGAMPDGFVYDTEPASRAVISMAQINADNIFAYFSSIQAAFYREQIDVTKTESLCQLAGQYDIDADLFMQTFDSDTSRQRTRQHFAAARQVGVTGFPSLVIQSGEDIEFISQGYCTLDSAMAAIERYLIKLAAV